MKIALLLVASLALIAFTITAVSATPEEEQASVTTAAPKKGWFDKVKEKAKDAANKVKEGAKNGAKKVKDGVNTLVNKVKGKGNKIHTTQAPMNTDSAASTTTEYSRTSAASEDAAFKTTEGTRSVNTESARR